ncbi:MAG: hypothetical protein JXR65_07225 [Bacteroidales bacterium]|nr:hypothetical protein [Bacteroidales bacterium]
MKIALVSLDQVWENKENNKTLCSSYVDFAKKQSCDLIVFPEMTLTGFTMHGAESLSEELSSSESLTFFVKESRRHQIGIVFGLITKGSDKPRNTLIFLNKEGKIVGRYSKIHPFSYANEHKYFDGGDQIIIAEFEGYRFGLSICYDLRFPEIFQLMSVNAEAIINIANWPAKRSGHWNILSSARAVENQVYMIGVNRTGVDGNNLIYEESSNIISPDGNVETPEITNNELKIYNIDLGQVKVIQEAFPMKNDRKVELYKKYLDAKR